MLLLAGVRYFLSLTLWFQNIDFVIADLCFMFWSSELKI